MANRFDLIRGTIKALPEAISETTRRFIAQPLLRGGFKEMFSPTKPAPTWKEAVNRFSGGLGEQFLAPSDMRTLTSPTATKEEKNKILEKGVMVVASVTEPLKNVGTPVSKLIRAIRTAEKATPALEVAQTVERAKRAAQVSGTLSRGGGLAGYKQALGQLKGELVAKPTFEPLGEKILSKTDVDDLFNQVHLNDRLDVYNKITASNGLQKLLKGQLPVKSELSLLEDVFGQDLIKEVMSKRPALEKIKDAITETLNVPRSLMTSFDMSSVLRQGIVLTTTKPKIAAGAGREMLRQVFSEENFIKWLSDLPNNPRYKLMKDSGLYIADPTKISTGLSAREERFMTNIAQKIPIVGSMVRASERSYVSYLNKLRVDTFTQLATKMEQEGIADAKNLKSLANFVNNATGRGDLGGLERSAQALNNVFFSPRLIASRFNMLNPAWYARQTPAVRKEAIKTMAEFIGVGSTVLALAKAGGAEVETDPRSTDFGKIKVGAVRWDIWGGFQQWVRVFSQLASGERKSTGSGKISKISKEVFPYETRLDVAERFLRGKMAPIPSLALELMEGQKMFGEKIELGPEIIENTIPLYIQGMKDAIDEVGPEALFTVGLPAMLGVGTQVYKEQKKQGRF